MEQIDNLLEMWRQDSEIDRTEPGKALLDIPKLHSKYLNILSQHRLLSKQAEFKYNKMKRLKWEYYTGKMDDDQLKKYGWEQFPYVLKSEITTYLESDEDINKYIASKTMHDEVVDVCQSILKELNSRTFQLRDFIAWERFIQGV
jgi:hypothetical protein